MKVGVAGKVSTVIGGFHLIGAKQERISWTIEQFQEAGVELIASGHCTGFDAAVAVRQAFGG
jgi:7,8-dihydropterin-6-yl-methyl-4-(beta-D-ribofuranosyl)aminobenzene 5'-phosphate synthase